MKNSFLKQLWVVLRIWIIAIALNTFLGTLLLAHIVTIAVIPAGIVFSAIFSAPIVVYLLIIINHGVSRRKSGQTIFNYVFAAGLSLTIFTSVVFLMLLPEAPPGLAVISFMAAGTSLGLHYYPIVNLANYNEFEKQKS